MAVVLVLVGVLALGWLRHQQRQQVELAAEVDRVRQQVTSVSPPQPSPSAGLGKQLPSVRVADHVVRDMVTWRA